MEIRHFSIMLHWWFIIKDRSNIGSTKLMLKKKKGYMLSGSVANENLCVFSSLVYFPSLSLIVHLHHSPSLPILPFFFPLLLLILLPPLPFPARVYSSWRKRMYSGHHNSWHHHAACHRGRAGMSGSMSFYLCLLCLFSLDSLLWKFFFFLCPVSSFLSLFIFFLFLPPFLTHSPPLPVQSLPATILFSFWEMPSLRGCFDLLILSSACDWTPELSVSSGNSHTESEVEEHRGACFPVLPLL